MSMKNSNDIIGNRTRDLPACSAVPQPTAPPQYISKLYLKDSDNYMFRLSFLNYLENSFAYFANFPLLLFVSVLFYFVPPPLISVCIHVLFSECPLCLIQILSTNLYVVTFWSEAEATFPVVCSWTRERRVPPEGRGPAEQSFWLSVTEVRGRNVLRDCR